MDNTKIVDIQLTEFNTSQFLSILICRDQLVNHLIHKLHEAQKNDLIDKSKNKYLLQCLKMCAVLYQKYQIEQAYFFTNNYQGKYQMANQLYKLFESNQVYINIIEQFKKNITQDNSLKLVHENILKRYNNMKGWYQKIVFSFSELDNQINEKNCEQYLLYQKLKEQMKEDNQVDYDIYCQLFQYFYKPELFQDAINNKQILELQAYCVKFMTLDKVYPIELCQNQMENHIKIKEETDLKYYQQIIEQYKNY